VVDSPHGGGKIPLMPNYLVSASDDAVVLRNYEGMLVRYQAEDKPNTVQATQAHGVSALLEGSKSALMPENNERMGRRRRLRVLAQRSPKPDLKLKRDSSCGGGHHEPVEELLYSHPDQT
jgi:lysine 2,3-aminomutase